MAPYTGSFCWPRCFCYLATCRHLLLLVTALFRLPRSVRLATWFLFMIRFCIRFFLFYTRCSLTAYYMSIHYAGIYRVWSQAQWCIMCCLSPLFSPPSPPCALSCVAFQLLDERSALLTETCDAFVQSLEDCMALAQSQISPVSFSSSCLHKVLVFVVTSIMS